MAAIILLLNLFLVLGQPAWAQIYGQDREQIKQVTGKLQVKKEKVTNISNSIAKMTKQIDFKKQELEAQNKKIEALQDELKSLQDSYLPVKTELDNLEQRVQKNLKQVIIFNMDNNDEAHDLYGKKLLIKNLKEDLKVLNEKKKENELYQQRLKMEEESIRDFLTVRDQLASTLKNLDEELFQKKLAKEIPPKEEKTPVPKVAKKPVATGASEVSEEATAELFTTLPDKNQGPSFLPPINHFTQLSHNKAGVYFQFQDVGPVRAPGAGEVVFCGELASYGNVVIMDHGDEIRTVVLGNFYPKIKKNDKLQMGDIIGYTVVDSEKKNTVLFEVRKKMVTQNSIHWLNKTNLKKKL